MSKDKYLSLFLAQMEGIVFVILQISFTTWAVRKLGTFLAVPQFLLGVVWSCDLLKPIMHGQKYYFNGL